MSLTSELKNPNSTISRWMKKNMDMNAVQQVVNHWNDRLAKCPPLVVQGVDPALVGTAFDYAFRWQVLPLTVHGLVAWQGRRKYSPAVQAQDEDTLKNIVRIGNESPERRAACCVVLSWYEGLFRGGPSRMSPGLSRADDLADDMAIHYQACLDNVPQADARDVAMLVETIPSVWGDRLKKPWIANPTFAGSEDVQGADADWILGKTLYDCKTSRKSRPFAVEHVLQVIGYVLLDYHNQYEIENVGWYFARQKLLIELPFVGGNAERLQALREDLKKELKLNQIGKPKRSKDMDALFAGLSGHYTDEW